jgi:hypothetical protein
MAVTLLIFLNNGYLLLDNLYVRKDACKKDIAHSFWEEVVTLA